MAMLVVTILDGLLAHSALVDLIQRTAAVAVPSVVVLLDRTVRRLMRKS